MGQVLYLECACGISGDMMAAALLDLGADTEVLERALNSLPVDGFETEISRVNKAGLDVCDFRVKLDAEHENHDHDMEYLYGHKAHHGHGRAHTHESYHGHGSEAEGKETRHGHEEGHTHAGHCRKL